VPADIGVICFNVGTLHALQRALACAEPLLSRVVTVTGGACRQPANYRVLLGTPMAHLLALSGYEPETGTRLLVGGPMMGMPLLDPQAPVTKTTLGIVAASAKELAPARDPQPCIRCGLCADVCPASLLPQQLLRHAVAGNHRELERHHLFDCIECGACAHVCPSAIPLVDHYRAAKIVVRERRDERDRADRAGRRFEAHQARALHREEEYARRREALAMTTDRPSPYPSPSPTPEPFSSAADLVREAQLRASTTAPRRAQLERALIAAQDRVAQLESQFAALDDGVADVQRKSLHARVQQARLDADLAHRRLAALPTQAPAADRGPQ
jgi:electron transport complex protein RnfC